MEKPVRTRIAPSPTGNLHVGTARAALFNYLFAKQAGGTFILRIEDTDTARSTKEFEKNMLDGLAWLGIDWDEGPELEGAGYRGTHGPYRQRERLEHYKKYLEQLLREGKAGYCDAKESAANTYEAHLCERHGGFNTEAKGIIRFDISALEQSEVMFEDVIRGRVNFAKELLGNFSIAKGLTEPLYNFAVVVDDREMEITHVIRGEDHIPNTPKQILILEALGFERPIYAHLPLLLGSDRSKLSKRHGATSVDDYRRQGYLPEALFNFLALLGWNPGDDREVMSEKEIIETFKLEQVQKAGAIFDTAKLEWMNGEYIRAMKPGDLVQHLYPYIAHLPGVEEAEPDYLEKIAALEQPRLKKLSEIGERVDYFFEEPEYNAALLSWKGTEAKDTAASLQKSISLITEHSGPFDRSELQRVFFAVIGEGDKGALLWPLRAALSGKRSSPSPFELLEVLGKERALTRLAAALKKLSG